MLWVPFVSSFLTSVALAPLVRRLSFRWGRVAMPRQDRWHRQPTPTLGGLGMFAAYLVGMVVTGVMQGGWQEMHWGLLLGASLMFFLGLYDDFKRLSPPAKLAGQILIAALVIFLGYTTNFFNAWIANPYLAAIPNDLLTFVWLIGITNAINLLDNMDGLAGGIAMITALIQGLLFWRGGDDLAWMALALVGAILGFLVFNFPPASVFMGDCGSLFLGFSLAGMAIARQPQASNVFAILGVPTLLFLLPILDTTLVTITRLMRGQSPAQGGRDHTSHRLIAFGLSERSAVLTLYAVALISGLAAILLESMAYWVSLIAAPLLVVIFALLAAYLGGLRVVSSVSPQAQEKALTRLMLELTYKRRVFEVGLDFFLIGIACYLSFFSGFGFTRGAGSLRLTLQTLPIVLTITYLAYFLTGVYRGIWRYVGVSDFVHYFQASMLAALASAGIVYFVYPQSFHFSAYIFLAAYLFLTLAASRSSFRLLDQISARRLHAGEQRILLYGAGDTGEMALRWILRNPQLEYQPVGFLDQDAFMIGRQIHSIEVLGSFDQLENILVRHQIAGVILTVDGLDEVARQSILATCQAHGCWLRSLRLEFETVE